MAKGTSMSRFPYCGPYNLHIPNISANFNACLAIPVALHMSLSVHMTASMTLGSQQTVAEHTKIGLERKVLGGPAFVRSSSGPGETATLLCR